MVYTNAVDPNGRLPNSVVSMTVADRAMIVGRLRRLLQAEPPTPTPTPNPNPNPNPNPITLTLTRSAAGGAGRVGRPVPTVPSRVPSTPSSYRCLTSYRFLALVFSPLLRWPRPQLLTPLAPARARSRSFGLTFLVSTP